MDEGWLIGLMMGAIGVVALMFVSVALRSGDRAMGHTEHLDNNRTAVAIARAQPAFPSLTHYSPHTQLTQAAERAALPGTAGAILDVPAPAPSFAALLSTGQIGPGRPLLLGYSDGQPLTGALKDWRSGAIAGLPGAGKTTTQRFIAGQAALQGARLVILDPHADAGEESLAGTLAPLAPAFLCEPATDPRAMVHALRLVDGIMQDRLHGAPVTYPLFVFVDEFTSLMGRSDLAGPLATLLEAIAQEGRKTLIQGVISGQIWTVNRAGGSALRDSLASTYVHRMKRGQAQVLLPTAEARKAETLPTGAAVLWRADGTLADVTIPWTSGADMLAIGRVLSRPDAVPMPSTYRPAADHEAAPPAPFDVPFVPVDGMDGTPDAYTLRVIGLYAGGKKLKEIIEELHPEIDVASGGRPFRAKRDALEELIQAELRRRPARGV
jgi:hypothetical protein